MDSPVVGGIVAMQTQGLHLIRGFGKACVTRTLVFASPGNPGWTYDAYTGYLQGYSASTGDWYLAGPAEMYDNGSWYYIDPSMYGSCPPNTAPIRANSYVLPDGGTLVPQIYAYRIRGYTSTWDNPLQYPDYYRIRDVMLCVKTDTTQ